MVAKVEVVSEDVRKPKAREFVELTCLDVESGPGRCISAFRFTLSESDAVKHKGKLVGKIVSVGLRELRPGFGGYVQATGPVLTIH